MFNDPVIWFDDPGVLFDAGVEPSPGSTDLLDYRVAVRGEGIVWLLMDNDRNPLGALMVNRDKACTIRNDTTRNLRRTVENMEIMPRPLTDDDPTHYYADDVDAQTMRVRAVWGFANGDTFPLGEFTWADDSEVIWSWGLPRTASLVDRMSDLDQPLDHSVGYSQGQLITDAITGLCDELGIGAGRRVIEHSEKRIAQPVGWAAGRDSFLTVFESLCSLAGFLPVYFDNEGRLVARSSPRLTGVDPDFTYGPDTAVLLGSAVRSSDLLTAPNRYIVVGGTPDAAVVGIFDVPDEAPNSYSRINRRRRKTVDLQGIETQDQADAAAQSEYVKDSSTYTWLSFDTPPDPRHDTYDIVEFESVNYRQLGWTLECRAGGRMTHDCRGTYNRRAA